jgi:hypothetical protein
VRAGLPPFLVIYADKDFPICARTSADFYDELVAKKCIAQKLEVKDRTHISLLLNLVVDDDPAFDAVLRFVTARPNGS